MRNHSMFQFRLALSSVALAIACLSPAVQAQTPEVEAKAVVPFGFEVGSTHFAAGAFSLSTRQDQAVSIRNASDGVISMVRHEDNLQPTPVSKLVFHKYGDRYFLAEVWAKNRMFHLCFIPSKAETQAKRIELASNPKAAKNNGVEVALLQTADR